MSSRSLTKEDYIFKITRRALGAEMFPEAATKFPVINPVTQEELSVWMDSLATEQRTQIFGEVVNRMKLNGAQG